MDACISHYKKEDLLNWEIVHEGQSAASTFGSMYFMLGRHRAGYSLFSSLLTERRKVSGDKDPPALTTMTSFSCTLTFSTCYAADIPLFRQEYAIDKKLKPKDVANMY